MKHPKIATQSFENIIAVGLNCRRESGPWIDYTKTDTKLTPSKLLLIWVFQGTRDPWTILVE